MLRHAEPHIPMMRHDRWLFDLTSKPQRERPNWGAIGSKRDLRQRRACAEGKQRLNLFAAAPSLADPHAGPCKPFDVIGIRNAFAKDRMQVASMRSQIVLTEVTGRPNLKDFPGGYFLAPANICLESCPTKTGPFPPYSVLPKIVARFHTYRWRAILSNYRTDKSACRANVGSGAHSFCARHFGIETFLWPDAGAITGCVEPGQRTALRVHEQWDITPTRRLEHHSTPNRVQQFHDRHDTHTKNDRIAGKSRSTIDLMAPLPIYSHNDYRFDARRISDNLVDGMTTVQRNTGRGNPPQ